jgi:NAD(P)-dependent dehydrogenase (short-subunit alcohol dehydrogenase family)
LTTALIDRIAKVHGRALNMSSAMHLGGNIGWTDLARVRGQYSSLAVYARSKLALAMFTRSLAQANSDRLSAISVQVPNVVSDAATILPAPRHWWTTRRPAHGWHCLATDSSVSADRDAGRRATR